MWDVFKDWIFDIIHFFYDFCGDWGLAIIIVTVIFRILISPLMHKQTKSSFQMQKVQPLMQELQRKYADDQPRLQEEMQKLYAEVKFNPLAGCLPMLLQMPIFMALFQVLSEMGSRTSGTTYEFYNLVPSLVMRPSEALAVGFGTFVPYLILMAPAKEKLESIARSSANRAASQNRSIKLRPMTPYERRIVHICLRDDDRVETASEGEGSARHVVILPR